MTSAERLVSALISRGLSVGTCESLTGGRVCAALTSVPGSSATVRGGLLTYATDLKTRLAGVSERVIADEGVVSEAVASAMATGAQKALSCDVVLACTGVAGPGPQDGVPAGTVWIAVATPGRVSTRRLAIEGDREAVRAGTVQALLDLVLLELGPESIEA